MRATVYLVRHGETLWNREKKYIGWNDQGIAPESRISLTSLHRKLTGTNFGLAFSSDLRRCRETAAIVGPGLTYEYDRRLREMNFGDFEGRTYEELKRVPPYRQWLRDPDNSAPPNGESGAEFKDRIRSFLRDLDERLLLHEEENCSVLIVSHGGAIREILSVWGLADRRDMPILHGSFIRVERRATNGEWVAELGE